MKSKNKLSFNNSHFFIGVDTHLKNWKVTIKFNSIELKTFSQNPSAIETGKEINLNQSFNSLSLFFQ